MNHAESLLKSFCITDPHEIDLEAIAFACGAIVEERNLDSSEAQIVGNGDQAIITINASSPYERRRFSIGHELGHWQYHRGQSFVCRSDDIGLQGAKYSSLHPERVADEYAANLLLPKYMFEPRTARDAAPTFDAIRSHARDFSASLTATTLRYCDLCSSPLVVICHDRTERLWFKRSKDIPSRLFPRNDLDVDSFAADILSGKSVPARPSLMGADAWFDVDGIDDYEIFEESIHFGDGRVLTILSHFNSEMLETYSD